MKMGGKLSISDKSVYRILFYFVGNRMVYIKEVVKLTK